jgi:hypothetical protein
MAAADFTACSAPPGNMPGIWDRLWVTMRRRAEACIRAGGEHMEHLLYGNVKS